MIDLTTTFYFLFLLALIMGMLIPFICMGIDEIFHYVWKKYAIWKDEQ